jgi:magnesium transporter
MTERRLAPLTALSTLTRRPARVKVRAPATRAVQPSAPLGRSRVIDNAVYS